MLEYAWLIPVFPLIAFLIIALGPKKLLLKENGAYWIIAMATASFALSALVIIDVLSGRTLTDIDSLTGLPTPRVDWLQVGGYTITFGIWVDQLTAVMLAVVSIVGTLVVVYSVGYMHEEGERKRRYYAEIALFIAVMFGLVLADNYLLMFIFWELVGLCSYLLIGFWKDKPSAASAAKRAFIVTRVGDIMLMSGLIMLLQATGTLDFATLFAQDSIQPPVMDGAYATVAMILLFGGAIGKSAQFPLHEWLPDAMEGPTTVSALIHAATMVKAGVYLVARSFPMLVQAPDSLVFIAVIGGITALIAASNALVMNDIKRVLAYSTISQLGYMMLALGAGGLVIAVLMHEPGESGLGTGYSSGMFHLMNHAFFKALLFLAAGSVIHGIGTQDMREMGGLRKTMKITSLTMLIGSLSIAGIPPFSGFWSKDEVLATTYEAFNIDSSYSLVFAILWIMGVLTAFMTAFYMFRMWFMTFSGEPKLPMKHPHESPRVMTVPLMILAVFAVGSGFAMFAGSGFLSFMSESIAGIGGSVVVEAVNPLEQLVEVFASPLTYVALLVSLGGLLLAYMVYYKGKWSVANLSKGITGRFQNLLANRYYISTAYDLFAYWIIYGMSRVMDIFDRKIIDGAVNGVAWISTKGGELLRKVQTGMVQTYVAIIVLGGCLLLAFLLIFGGV